MNHNRMVLLVLCTHIGLLAYSASTHSPTMDEPAYLVAGISHWRFGTFEITRVCPPLVRLVAAVPVMFSAPKENWNNVQRGVGARGEHYVGHDFLFANGRRSFWLFTIARWACIPFSLVGAYTCYRWSLSLWGRRSALAALALWCFCPNILAHGGLMTPDVGVTALSVAASYLFWIWFQQRTWLSAAVAGAVLGAAILAKTNAIVLILFLPAIALIALIVQPQASSKFLRSLAQLMLGVFTAIYALNLGYGFEGSLTRLDRYSFVSGTFRGTTDETGADNRFSGSLIGRLPVPLPKPFLEGIDIQRKDFENINASEKTYFRGQWYDHGWWWFYIYVVAVKIPLAAWALFLWALFTQVTIAGVSSLFRPNIMFMALPGLVLFALACSQTGIGHGLRYVLPAVPFALIFSSGALRDRVKDVRSIAFSWLLLTCHVVSSISVYPHSLAYFNLLAGGPSNGHSHLLDGNLDWGQDFLYLEQWIRNHPEAKPLHIGFWGFLPLDAFEANYSTFDFKIADQKEDPDVSNLPAGWYVISVNNAHGDFNVDNRKYRSFLERIPITTIGYTTYVYRIPR